MVNKNHHILFLLCIILILYSFGLTAQDQDIKLDLRIVPEEDFKDILSDSKVTIKDEVTDQIYVNKFYEDGTVTSKRGKKKWQGIWFVDSKGKHCIRWNHKDKSNCALIMQDENGNWVKVKDDEIIKRYENIESISPKDYNLPDFGTSVK